MNICKKTGAIGALFGATAVTLGAMGAHTLKGQFTFNGESLWQTATLYLFIHALALVLLSIIGAPNPKKNPFSGIVALLWIAGCLLFSGSLYVVALGAPQSLAHITPIGGTAFILGWIGLAYIFLSKKIE